MARQFSFVDDDGYSVAFEDNDGRGVLVARSDSGAEIAVYLSGDAAQQLSATLAGWAAR